MLICNRILNIIKKDIYNKLNEDSSIRYYNIPIDITYRLKSFNRIINKIKNKHKTPKDIIGFRIIYNNDNEDISYKILNNLERNYIVMKDSYKDYIVNKKENDYQSLHLVIIVKNIPIEIQIRNSEMDYISKYGKASDYH